MKNTQRNLLALAIIQVLLFSPSVFSGEGHNHIEAEANDLPEKKVHLHIEEAEHDHDADHEEESEHNHAEKSDHDEESEHNHVETSSADQEEHGEGGVTLSAQQMKIAGIQSTVIEPYQVKYSRYAPAEVKANGYTSYLASPRVDSVVLRRHANLGEHVETGQPLVTLFSETVADAQAQYLSSSAEWKRVNQLGRKAVGDKRFISAKADNQAATSRLLAYGLDSASIKTLGKNNQALLGEYTLKAQIDGAVLSDDFNQGQRISAGAELMELANESELWVEARLPANQNLILDKGTEAIIKVGSESFVGTVAQEAHTIDEVTRTRIVRLLVNNVGHRLHPGMFADVYFQFESERPVMAVNEGAILRGADGDWTVFVEDHPGEFLPVEIERGRSLGELREIIGIKAGSKVVTSGAFFVASQIAKGGFDPHNH
jgi:cobalt-zinc-cadmium efflux system membrane fusion protein|tara:strand:- start:6941 stop:8230 length:1290 start_codon:yes stop_codon:yes gene_type:complete